jgi:hypothetical protein
MVLACGGGGNYEPRTGDTKHASKPVENLIAYEVLEKRDAFKTMTILVSESATKEEILRLAESLKRSYDNDWHISIFDSRDLYLHIQKYLALEEEAGHADLKNAPRGHVFTKQEMQAMNRRSERFAENLHLDEEEAKHCLVVISDGEVKWVASEYKSPEERAKERRAEEARNKAEAEAREARAETRKKAQEEARKEAAQKKVEERAASYLRYAKKLIGRGMEERAKERLQEIVKDLPDTKAAKEAKQLLHTLDK